MFEDSSKRGLGGGQQITLCAVRALRDHEVRLLDSSEKVVEEARKWHPRLSFTMLPFRGKRVRCTSAFSFPSNEVILTVLQLIRALLRVLPLMRRERPDVFYCPSRKGLLLALLLRAIIQQRIRTIYHAHLVLPDGFLPRAFIRLVARACDVVLCVSHPVFRQMRGQRLLLPNPLRVKAVPVPRVARGRPVVGFVGSLLASKGFDLFLAVAREYGHRFQFCIFTHDDPSELDVPVCVHRSLPVDQIYSRIDVLLICSRVSEAFSLVALEASAFDVPVVFPRQQQALLDFLVPGVSGEAYQEATVIAIGECLERVVENLDSYHPRHAIDWDRFDPTRFEASIKEVLTG